MYEGVFILTLVLYYSVVVEIEIWFFGVFWGPRLACHPR